MAERDDLMKIGMSAMQEAKDVAVQMVRDGKSQVVNAPAFGKELKRDERITEHLTFINNPGTMELSWDELETRFKVEEGKIPRRWLEYGKLVKRELDEEEGRAKKELNGNS